MNSRLKYMIAITVAGILLAMAVTAGAEDGRVLAVIGEATIQRGEQLIKLEKGTPIQVGDLVRTGERAAVQLHMSDNSILALRQNSEMEIAGYRFASDKPTENEARFSLIRGGVRTLTGEIATQARQNYEVKTVVATIGIRGTHFRLRLCEGDCANEGADAPRDGLYGGVSEGRIAVTNEAGELVLGVDEFFFVADSTFMPERLPAPPALLNDRLASLAAARRSGATAASSPAQEAPPSDSLPPEPAIPSATENLNILTMGQLRAIENSIAPENLAHIEPIIIPPSPPPPPPSNGDFVDVGGSGDIRGQIVWMTNADIDLHLQAPTGDRIYYGNPQVPLGSSATAQLDHDNLGGTIDVAPDQRVENITVTGTQIPVGQYNFSAHSFSGNNNGLPTNVQIRVTGDGNHTSLADTVSLADGQTSNRYVVDFQGANVAPQYSVQPQTTPQ